VAHPTFRVIFIHFVSFFFSSFFLFFLFFFVLFFFSFFSESPHEKVDGSKENREGKLVSSGMKKFNSILTRYSGRGILKKSVVL